MELKSLLSLVRKPANARDEIVSALAAIDVAAAERQADALEIERRRVLVSGDDRDLAAIEEKIVAANRQIERSLAMREEFEARLDRLDDTAAEQARKKAYDFALSERGRAEKALKRYPAVARQIVELLAEIATAELAIASANADLPAGAVSIGLAEMHLRGLPADEREIVSEESFAAWHYEAGGGAVDQKDSGKIFSTDGRTGRLDLSRDGALRSYRVIKRDFVRQSINEGRPAYQPASLAASITLPGLLPGQPEIWFPYEGGAAEKLARIEDARGEWSVPSTDPRPPRNSFSRVIPAERASDAARP